MRHGGGGSRRGMSLVVVKDCSHGSGFVHNVKDPLIAILDTEKQEVMYFFLGCVHGVLEITEAVEVHKSAGTRFYSDCVNCMSILSPHF